MSSLRKFCSRQLGPPAATKNRLLTIVTDGDQCLTLSWYTLDMFSRIRLWELSLTQPYKISVGVKSLVLVALRSGVLNFVYPLLAIVSRTIDFRFTGFISF